MTRLTIILILILPLSLTAQRRKKNVFKPICIATDYVARSVQEGPFQFSYSFEYERQFSRRTSVNFAFLNFPVKTDHLNYENAPQEPGYSYSYGEYEESLWGLGYESRYYFNDFETDGTSSGYVGFCYQYLSGKQNLVNAVYKEQNNSTLKTISFPTEHFSIHRPGIRLGHVWQGALYSDLYFAVIGNFMSYSTANKIKPVEVFPVSIQVGWNIGIPF